MMGKRLALAKNTNLGLFPTGRRHGQSAVRMNHYTNTELTDIYFIYIQLYGDIYLKRWPLNYQSFAQVHQNLAEHGSFRATIEGTRRPQTARTPTFEEDMLHPVDPNPGINIRELAVATRRSRTAVYRVLQAFWNAYGMHTSVWKVCIRGHLDQIFPNRWTGCGDPVTCHLKFIDLSHLHVFLWSTMKNLVYNMPINSEMNPVA
ncbi:hypothetical protein TNCV_2089851 [Trichonephila clavipes]|nr:hypothetical protein TNCV_2089851 [Trichonephila clavipes]